MNRRYRFNKTRFVRAVIVIGIAGITIVGLVKHSDYIYGISDEKEIVVEPDIIAEETVNEVINDEAYQEPQMPEYEIPLSIELQQFIWDTCSSYENGVGYGYVLSVIKKENSQMDVNAININKDGSKDLGLMQLNEKTAYKLAEELQIENFNPFNPYDNLRVGIYYLNIMYTNFSEICSEEDTTMALSMAFNRGGNRTKALILKHGVGIAYRNDYANKVLEYKMQLEQNGSFN